MSILGRTLSFLTGQKSYEAQIAKKPSHFHGILWGGFPIPHESANTHFCFVGATGSGKTVSIKLLMQTVLPFIGIRARSNGKWLDHRALIYDAKQDILSILAGMGLPSEVKVKTLNPFDKDGYAWDIAKDIKERAHAQEFATILIPPEPNSQQPFFGDAARGLLEGVVTSLMITAGEKWTFRDVVYVMGSQERIIECLDQTEETRELIALYFGNDETTKNIMSTVGTKIKSYKIIAALWDKAILAEKTVSLAEWLMSPEEREKQGVRESNNYILVLGNDETARTAIDSINQAIFNRVSQLILSQKNIKRSRDVERDWVSVGTLDRRRHWIILDEVGEAGRLPGLDSLMTKGRSKGAAVVLGFQDINGLQAVYGEKEAYKLVGQCSNYATLRIQSPATAEWAASLYGELEAEEEYTDKNSSNTSSGWGNNSSTYGTSTRVAYREVKMLKTGQLINMKAVDIENGLSGYYLSPYIAEPYGATIAGDLLFRTWLDEEDEIEMQRRDPEDQKLMPWNKERNDRERLGLKVSRKQKLRTLRESKKKAEEIATEIAEIAFFEKRQALTPKEIEDLLAVGEDAIKICSEKIDELFGNKKEKVSERQQRIQYLKQQEQKGKELAVEIAELVFREGRQELTDKEAKELEAVSEKTVFLCRDYLSKFWGENVKEPTLVTDENPVRKGMKRKAKIVDEGVLVSE